MTVSMHAGPRFILVRGLAREAAHWHDFDEGLRTRFPGARVERVDLPGNGERWRERSPLSTRESAAYLREQVWAASEQPVVLIAISLGAMVCLEWLRSWPSDAILGLAAINTSAGGLCPPWQRMRPRAMVETLRSIGERDPVARERAILELTTTGHGADRELAEQHAEFHRLRPIRRANVLRQAVSAARFRVKVKPLAAPVLVLNSAADQMVDPSCSRALTVALGADLAVHPSGGHDLTLDDPKWCAEAIHRWLVEGRRIDCAAGTGLAAE